MTTTPVLPPFYGKPIDTPVGHRWAGHTAPRPFTGRDGRPQGHPPIWR